MFLKNNLRPRPLNFKPMNSSNIFAVDDFVICLCLDLGWKFYLTWFFVFRFTKTTTKPPNQSRRSRQRRRRGSPWPQCRPLGQEGLRLKMRIVKSRPTSQRLGEGSTWSPSVPLQTRRKTAESSNLFLMRFEFDETKKSCRVIFLCDLCGTLIWCDLMKRWNWIEVL